MAGGINPLGNTPGKVDSNNNLLVAIGAGSVLPDGTAIDAGTGTADGLLPSVLHVNITAVGNVGTGEDNLMTYALPANTLSANKYGLRVTAWGKTAANANSKTVALYFGSDQLASTGANATNNGAWRFVTDIVRTGAATEDASAAVTYGVSGGAATVRNAFTACTQDTTAAITIKCTGDATTDNDVVQEGLRVEFLPAV